MALDPRSLDNEVLPDGRVVPAHGTERRYKSRTAPCNCALCLAGHALYNRDNRNSRAQLVGRRNGLRPDFRGTPMTSRCMVEVNDALRDGINAEMERYSLTKSETIRRLLAEALDRRRLQRERGEST